MAGRCGFAAAASGGKGDAEAAKPPGAVPLLNKTSA